jgi:hypothetical protein
MLGLIVFLFEYFFEKEQMMKIEIVNWRWLRLW